MLTEDQQAAFNAIQEGKNVFLTGPAGTGKSYLLQHILENIKGKRIALTAMTGCAALLISTPKHKAKTLHSWAGIGLAKESVTELCKKIQASYHVAKRWMTTQLLVIDEISMMTPELLEKLNEIAKKIKKSEKPFGGIQVIFVGDFYQLPPVSATESKFAFESPQWSEIIQRTALLTTINRQKDPQFQRLLNEARIGKLSPSSIDVINSRIIPYESQEIKPTLLFSRRADVDLLNYKKLSGLTGERQTYKAAFAFGAKSEYTKVTPTLITLAEKYDKDAQYVPSLEIAIGAQVMLIVNIKSKPKGDSIEDDDENGLMLVNGSRGVVIGFERELPVVKFKNGLTKLIDYHSWQLGDLEEVYRTQIPLRLAYAISIHKAQGATLDCALIDVGPSTFEYGQAYVALSRVKSLDSLYIKAFDPRAIKANPKVAKFYEETA
jgi:ATP-dependent DNA helicase PIF1